MKYSELLHHYPIISNQISAPALGVVLAELEAVIDRQVPGEIAEFGCYVGTTSLFIRRLLDVMQQSEKRQFYVYDSFEGLPEKTPPDASGAGMEFQAGELRTSKKELLRTFQKAHLQPPIIHKSWFKDLNEKQIPAQLSFAFLDGDFYESILDSLEHVWQRLSTGGIITIDDYQRAALPGVTKAVYHFFGSQPINIHYAHNIAIIKKS